MDLMGGGADQLQSATGVGRYVARECRDTESACECYCFCGE